MRIINNITIDQTARKGKRYTDEEIEALCNQARIDELTAIKNNKEVVTEHKERFNFDAVNVAYIDQRIAELQAKETEKE